MGGRFCIMVSSPFLFLLLFVILESGMLTEDANSSRVVHVPGGDTRGAGVQQGRRPGDPAAPGRRLVGGHGAERERHGWAGPEQLPAAVLGAVGVSG